VIEVNALVSRAMLHSGLRTGAINQEAAHGFRGRGEKVGSIVEMRFSIPRQALPGLMNEGSGLKRLVCGFMSHFLARQLPLFLINERQQLIRGTGLSLFNALKDLCRFAHGEREQRES
jgi:hypothetical protein